MEWDEDLISYRLERAHETLEDAHILANSERWNACVMRSKSGILMYGLS